MNQVEQWDNAWDNLRKSFNREFKNFFKAIAITLVSAIIILLIFK